MDGFQVRRQDYSLDEDQQAVREAFSNFFVSECPSSVVRAAEPLGFDGGLWAKLVGMGVTSMSLPPESGGDGGTLVDLVLIAEELGRVAAPLPFCSHVVTTRLLGVARADDKILAEAFAGDSPFALAFDPVRSGHPQLVADAAIARRVVALERDTLVLYRAEQPAAHVTNQGSTPLAWWEPTPGGEKLTLAHGERASTLHARAVAEWKLLMAAALVGLTETALGLAVDFVNARETMGVPVGALQGVSFPLADVAIGVASARNLIWRAAWMTENEPAERPELVSMAFAFACQTVTHGATTAAHMQGGLGFTVDADASLYFLRAKGWSVLGGDPALDLIAVGGALLAAV